MRIDARARRTAMALAVCLIFPLPPAAAARRAFRRRHQAASQPIRVVIKAKLKAERQKISQNRSHLSAVKEDIRNTQSDLRVKKTQVARLSDQVRELQVRVDEAARRLRGAARRLELAQRRVEEGTYRLQKAELRLAAHRRRLSRRIARSYEAGTVTFVEVLLKASSLADFLDRQYYVERFLNSVVQFLTELRAEMQTGAQVGAAQDQERLAQETTENESTLCSQL